MHSKRDCKEGENSPRITVGELHKKGHKVSINSFGHHLHGNKLLGVQAGNAFPSPTFKIFKLEDFDNHFRYFVGALRFIWRSGSLEWQLVKRLVRNKRRFCGKAPPGHC